MGRRASDQAGVQFFREDKGYGFIVPDNGGDDLFVHARAVQGTPEGSLVRDVAVTFDVQPSPRGKGPMAVNVTLA